MKWVQRQRTKALLISLAFLAVLGIFLGWLSRRGSYRQVSTLSRSPAPEFSADATSTPATNASPSSEMSPAASPAADKPGTQSTPTLAVSPAGLIIPVAGVRSDQLVDTFSAARGEGRVHDAIDIPAPQGTPVLAAAGGKIIRLFQSKAGGTTIYQLSSDEKFIYYYAHLDRYADGLQEGRVVMQGETIAYVGDTGNAGAGNYHLHFSVAITSDPKRWWEGVNINPYPLLRK
jgi:murein DD-endopeptidase MepM/ murein hydrolase activator NlpD